MKTRRYVVWGVCVSCASVLGIAVVSFVHSAMSYDGECGGLMPFLGGTRPCSFWDHASSDLGLFVVLNVGYGPIVLATLLVPPLIGYLLDRHRAAG